MCETWRQEEEIWESKCNKRNDEKDSEARPANTCDHADDDIEDDERDRHTPEFTRQELMIAIDSLNKGKSADSKGIKAEDIKGADEETTAMIHEIFNLIIKQWLPTHGKSSVIYKKGDVTNREKLPADLCLPTALQTLFHDAIQQASRRA